MCKLLRWSKHNNKNLLLARCMSSSVNCVNNGWKNAKRCSVYPNTRWHRLDCWWPHSVGVTECGHRKAEQQRAAGRSQSIVQLAPWHSRRVRRIPSWTKDGVVSEPVRLATARSQHSCGICHHVRPMPGQDRPGGRSWRPHWASRTATYLSTVIINPLCHWMACSSSCSCSIICKKEFHQLVCFTGVDSSLPSFCRLSMWCCCVSTLFFLFIRLCLFFLNFLVEFGSLLIEDIIDEASLFSLSAVGVVTSNNNPLGVRLLRGAFFRSGLRFFCVMSDLISSSSDESILFELLLKIDPDNGLVS